MVNIPLKLKVLLHCIAREDDLDPLLCIVILHITKARLGVSLSVPLIFSWCSKYELALLETAYTRTPVALRCTVYWPEVSARSAVESRLLVRVTILVLQVRSIVQ